MCSAIDYNTQILWSFSTHKLIWNIYEIVYVEDKILVITSNMFLWDTVVHKGKVGEIRSQKVAWHANVPKIVLNNL